MAARLWLGSVETFNFIQSVRSVPDFTTYDSLLCFSEAFGVGHQYDFDFVGRAVSVILKATTHVTNHEITIGKIRRQKSGAREIVGIFRLGVPIHSEDITRN